MIKMYMAHISYRLSCGYMKALRNQPLEVDFPGYLQKSYFNPIQDGLFLDWSGMVCVWMGGEGK